VADVAIIHPADKGTAATRLAEALVAAGFAVDSFQVEDPSGLADALEGSAADARILIWSRPLVSHALHSGELTRIRQLRGLIEVSADGIAPPSRGDDSRVVSISGWRGQPFHPGWQRIHLELKRLSVPGKNAFASAPPPAAAEEPRRERAAPAASSGGASPRPRRLMLGAGAAVLLAAAGAASWFAGGASDSPPRPELAQARAPGSIGDPPRTEPVAEPGSTNPSKAAPPPLQGPAPPLAVKPPAAAAEAKPDAPRTKPAVRPDPARPAARAKPRPSPQSEPAKRYSRRNSKVMRQFCERSGRSTPQCRTFLRSLRDSEASD
jgi:hypothetical protein